MALIEKFEDVQAWQEARKLTRQTYAASSRGTFAKDFGLRDQICRAAVSSMTNTVEGFDCASKTDFARFLGYSRRAAVEVQSLLYMALDAGHISEEIFESCYEQARKAKALIGGLKQSLKRPAT